MKIIVAGQGPFGEKVLKALLRKGEAMQGVFCPRGRPGDGMKALAVDSKLGVFQPKRMKDPEVQEAYQTLSPDLVVLAFVTDILPRELLEIPSLGTICYHPSLLPKHRGASSINRAIIQGEAKTGLTILWADAGIDTGPVLLQREVAIEPEETTGSLYFNKLFPLGVEAVAEAVELVKKGQAPSIPQDEDLATYEPPCDDRVAEIDWSKPGRQVFDLIRGCDPQPGAHTTFQGEKLRLYQPAGFEAAGPGNPGEILELEPGGLLVSLGSATCRIKKIRGEDGKKLDSREFAEKVGLQKGMRFGS